MRLNTLVRGIIMQHRKETSEAIKRIETLLTRNSEMISKREAADKAMKRLWQRQSDLYNRLRTIREQETEKVSNELRKYITEMNAKAKEPKRILWAVVANRTHISRAIAYFGLKDSAVTMVRTLNSHKLNTKYCTIPVKVSISDFEVTTDEKPTISDQKTKSE
jgi:hypothetical protein